MSVPRAPKTTVGFVDQDCASYQEVFAKVRSFDPCKCLHLGLLAGLPRKTLRAMAWVVGLEEGSRLHYVLANSLWEVATLRNKRLKVVKQDVADRPLLLYLDGPAIRKNGSRRMMWRSHTLAIWVRLPQGWFGFMLMASWTRSPFAGG